MATATVTVTIDAQGKVTVAAAGVIGQGCAAMTQAIERDLGQTVADVKKPEFYRTAQQANPASR
jgi:hypothetical protein